MEAIERSFHEQGSPEWFKERLGKFTSSELHKLLTEGRKKDEMFGQGARTYIFQKLNELVTGEVEQTDLSFKDSISWGHAHELEALELYSELTGNPVEPCGFEPCVDPYFVEMFGGSPDGKIYNKAITEVKCPFIGGNHMANLALADAAAFAAMHPKYYTQIQGNLFATGLERCDFISYDPRPLNIFNRIKIIPIYRDNVVIEEIKIKVPAGYDVLLTHFERVVTQAASFNEYMKSLKIAA